MEEPIISVSGLRGIIGRTLTPEVALRFTAALAAQLGPGSVLIARDGRTTGPMLAQAVAAGLRACGRAVIDVGVASTPTVGVAVRARQAAGGVQISASHNPSEWNGLKLFGSDGRVLTAEKGERVLQRYRAGQPEYAAFDKVGDFSLWSEAYQPHLKLITESVEVETIVAKRFAVLLDANHGSGGQLGRALLERLGCRVTILGETADGQFSHPPEPTAENLATVLSAVRECGAAVGFCQDPDADRLALIDETGRYIGEECTLALCIDHVLRQRPGPVVTNCSTSRMTEDLAAKYNVPFARSKVGEANVVDQMVSLQAVLGGEGNGGVIDPRIGYVRDSFIGMALILEYLAATGEPLSVLADRLPQYAIAKHKVPLARSELTQALDRLAEHFGQATVDRTDGLRLDWPAQETGGSRWLLVRPSNTEPIVRVFAEAKTRPQAEELCRQAAEVLVS